MSVEEKDKVSKKASAMTVIACMMAGVLMGRALTIPVISFLETRAHPRPGHVRSLEAADFVVASDEPGKVDLPEVIPMGNLVGFTGENSQPAGIVAGTMSHVINIDGVYHFGSLGHISGVDLAGSSVFPVSSRVGSYDDGQLRLGSSAVKDGEDKGTVMSDTMKGVFGELSGKPQTENQPTSVGLPVAGPAQIITNIDESGKRAFDIEILHSATFQRYDSSTGRGVAIKVIDPDWPEKLHNSLVPGMSGSPILQDGKLVAIATNAPVLTYSNGETTSSGGANFGVLAIDVINEHLRQIEITEQARQIQQRIRGGDVQGK